MAVSWMKRGAESAKEIEKAEAETKAKFEQNQKMWRFFLSDNEESQITFVDGNLTKEGVLDLITYKEHRVFMNGSWNNFFVCTQDVEPCPVCATGDTPSLVGVLTIIDHRTFKSKKDGHEYTDTPKLFVAKRDTLKILQKAAAKRGGLAGCRYDVTRSGAKSAAVGTQFEFVDKGDIKDLKAKYTTMVNGKAVSNFQPADYEKELAYKPASELAALFGVGHSLGSGDTKPSNLADEL